MQRITTIDLKNQRDPSGRLYGPSQRFGVRTYIDQGTGNDPRLISSLSVKRRADALADAKKWTTEKRGCMAVAYSRTTGLVVAQYYQDQQGTVGWLVYSLRGKLVETQHPELFEDVRPPVENGSTPTQAQRAPDRLPLTAHAPSCIFPLVDEMHPENILYVSIRPSANGVLVTASTEPPAGDADEGLHTMADVMVDLFDGKLSILYWDDENQQDDPHKIVLVEDVARWEPAPQDDETN